MLFVALGLTRGEYGRGSVETGVRIWRKGYLGSAQLLLETKTRGWGGTENRGLAGGGEHSPIDQAPQLLPPSFVSK